MGIGGIKMNDWFSLILATEIFATGMLVGGLIALIIDWIVPNLKEKIL